MEAGDHRRIDPAGGADVPTLSEDVRTLLAATVIDVCAATGVPFCTVSRVRSDDAVVAAAHGAGPAGFAAGAAWRVSDSPPARQALATQRPVILVARDDPRLTTGQRNALTGHPDMHSLAFVPLLARPGARGLLVLGDRRPRDLGPEVAHLAPIVRLMGQVLEQDERLDGLSRSADDLALVLDADIEAQRRPAGPDQVLRVVARRLAELCHAPMVEIYAVDGENLRHLVSWQYGRFADEAAGRTATPAELPLSHAVVVSGRPEVVPSVDDPRLPETYRDGLRQRNARSFFSIPLLSNGRVIGVAEVLDNRPRDFGEVARPARALGEIAAHLLDKALLLEALEQRNASLREIVKLGARINAAGRPEDMATFVAQRLLDMLGATCCEVHKIDHGRLRCLLSIDRRLSRDDTTAADRTGARDPVEVGATMHGHELIVLTGPDDARLSADQRRVWERNGFASQLSVPLVIDDRFVGVIDVFDVRPRRFADHIDFARSVGQLVAGAFDNLLLLERLAESNQQLGVLAESSLEFGASLDLTEVLHSVASRMCLAAAARCCDVYSIEGERLVGLVSTDGSAIDESFPGTAYDLADYAIARRAIDLGQPVIVADVCDDPRLTAVERTEDLRWGYSSLVELPLIDRGEAIGIATLFDLENADVAHTDLLRGLAQIAAQAIANARVHAALDEGAARLRQINEAGLELASSLDLSRVLEAVARRLCDIAAVDSCAVYTLHGRQLHCEANLMRGVRDETWLTRSHDLDDWRASRLAVESRSVVRSAGRDGRLDERDETDPRRRTRNGGLIVPLLVERRVIGVVELFDTARDRAFSDDDIASAEAVCRVAAMAIANAGLFHDAELRSRESELLNQIAARASSSLDTATIAASTVEELGTLVAFTEACLAIRRDAGDWDTVYSSSSDVATLATKQAATEDDALETLRTERVSVLDIPGEPAVGTVDAGSRLRSLLVIGIFIDDAIAGVLALGSPEREAFAGADREILERVGALLALSFKNARLYETIKTMHVANLKALISALNARDYYAVGHAARVAAYMLLLGRELDWPQNRLQQITEAAFLHDVGRIGISDDVLYKPGRLNDEEAAELRRHPIASAEIIQPLFTPELVGAVRHHHERWDGAGYPDGLAGERIPEVARALCIVDSYDAMSFQRQHHEALSYAECLAELDRCRGGQFDPDMVTAFMRVLDRLDERRSVARGAAEEAASRVDPATLADLTKSRDESSADFAETATILREVRDAHPGVRFLTAIAPGHDGWRMVCDPEEEPALHSHPGDLVDRTALTDESIGLESDHNVLQLDDFGVWVSGGAEVRDAEGALLGIACADLPPADDWPADLGAGAGHDPTFSAIVESATARLGRARVDAVTDGLTGLYNQRYFKQRLSEEVERAAEQGRPVSLLFCDLDHFKGYNDRLGHVAGDKALRAVAGVLLHSIRQVDLAARYGGEELTVILLDTPGDAAVEVAERIRQGVAALDLGGEGRGITVSIGTAAFPEDATLMEELVDKADWAMYLAKRKGRDRIVSFGRAGGAQEAERPTPGQRRRD